MGVLALFIDLSHQHQGIAYVRPKYVIVGMDAGHQAMPVDVEPYVIVSNGRICPLALGQVSQNVSRRGDVWGEDLDCATRASSHGEDSQQFFDFTRELCVTHRSLRVDKFLRGQIREHGPAA